MISNLPRMKPTNPLSRSKRLVMRFWAKAKMDSKAERRVLKRERKMSKMEVRRLEMPSVTEAMVDF